MRVLTTVRCWGHFTDFLEYPAKISGVAKSTLGSDLFQSHWIGPQHELSAVHPYKIEVIIKPHETFLPEQPGDVVRSQTKVLSNRVPRNRSLNILLNIKTERF